ncbi:MAG TPA: hypothetical protein DCK83_12555 [Gallionellaceae bacterium]|nr:hypothetical protein [Gallionellaceae bacterium]
MEEYQGNPRYPTNWGVRFLCDCKKENKEINIHKGVAHDISIRSIHILSDHHICQQKKIAMQLLIPSLQDGIPQKIVKIIGHSLDTIMKEGRFLTEVEFRHFEEDGQKILEKNLRQRFDTHPYVQTAQRA